MIALIDAILWTILIIYISYLFSVVLYVLSLPANNPKTFLKHKEIACPGRKRIVVIGDSITHGNASKNYVQMLGERLRKKDGKLFDIINAGINSDFSWNVLQRIDDIIACAPDFITVLIGTNDANVTLGPFSAPIDIWSKKLPQFPTADWFRANLEEILSTLKDLTNAKIGVFSLPTIGEDPTSPEFKKGQEYSAIIKDVAEHAGIDYLPLCEAMTGYLKEHPSSPRFTYAHEFIALVLQFVLHYHGASYAWLSKRVSGFQLHADFLHLNEQGAAMIVDLIEKFVLGDKEIEAPHKPRKLKTKGFLVRSIKEDLVMTSSTVLIPKRINNDGLRTAFLLGLVSMDGYKLLCHLDEEMTYKMLVEKLGWTEDKANDVIQHLLNEGLVDIA